VRRSRQHRIRSADRERRTHERLVVVVKEVVDGSAGLGTDKDRVEADVSQKKEEGAIVGVADAGREPDAVVILREQVSDDFSMLWVAAWRCDCAVRSARTILRMHRPQEEQW